MKNRTFTFSGDYDRTLSLAENFAALTEERILCQDHLLAALLKTNPELMMHILSLSTLAVPARLKLKRCETSSTSSCVTLSSQVSRLLSLHGGRMDEVLKALGITKGEIGLVHLTLALLVKPRGPMLEFLELNRIDPTRHGFFDDCLSRARGDLETDRLLSLERERPGRIRALREIRETLFSVCHGQNEAVYSLMGQIATSSAQSPIDRDRKPLSFAFIGAPGTGKSLLASRFGSEWSKRFDVGDVEVLDMSRFAVESLIPDIAGRDPGWRDGGKPGELTRLAARNPHGVIVIENLDKAHPGALVPITKALSSGYVFDEFTKEDVSFLDNIIILITNRGANYVDSGAFARLCKRSGGNIPRESLVEGISAALTADVRDKAGILGEIFTKVTRLIVFHRHTADSLAAIAADGVEHTLARLRQTFNAEVVADPEALSAFFVETRRNLDSAHGLAESVETTLSTSLENGFLDLEDAASGLKKITIEVDELPALDKPVDSLAERTRVRLAEAKRLDYAVKVEFLGNEANIRLTDFRHTVLPSIEDAGWFAVTPPDVKADDLVGLDTAWKEARKLLFRLDPNQPSALKRGHLLLYGPPGTGKTAFAKAIAGTLGKNIICVNASTLTSDTPQKRAIDQVSALFAAAERTGSIVFLDECDALGSRDAATSTQAAVINTLLTLLDGFEDNGVFVIGATNRPELLDRALTRAGRLHSRIKIDVLRKNEDIAKLIDIYCRKTSRRIPSELKDFIIATSYEWAPANILSVLAETFELAGSAEPTREHFIRARNTDFSGRETQHRTLSDTDRRHVAIHEAGHALMASLHHHPWIQVTIDGFGRTVGFLERKHVASVGYSKERLLENIDISLAGNAAERLFDTVAEGSESDFLNATESARRALSGGFNEDGELALREEDEDWKIVRPKVNRLLKERLDFTIRTLSDHKDELKRIVEELLLKGTVFSDDITRRVGKER